jgi:hypothetical protein
VACRAARTACGTGLLPVNIALCGRYYKIFDGFPCVITLDIQIIRPRDGFIVYVKNRFNFQVPFLVHIGVIDRATIILDDFVDYFGRRPPVPAANNIKP